MRVLKAFFCALIVVMAVTIEFGIGKPALVDFAEGWALPLCSAGNLHQRWAS